MEMWINWWGVIYENVDQLVECDLKMWICWCSVTCENVDQLVECDIK